MSGYMVFDVSLVENETTVAELRKCFSCCKTQHLFAGGKKLDDDKSISSSGLRDWDEIKLTGKEDFSELQLRCGSWWWQEHEVGKAWKRWRAHIYHCMNHQAVDRALKHTSWKKSELDEVCSPLESLIVQGHERRQACAALKRAGGRVEDALRIIRSGEVSTQQKALTVDVRPFALGDGKELVQLEKELVAEGKPVMTTLMDMDGAAKASRVFVAVAINADGKMVGYAVWKRMPGHAWSSLQDHCGHKHATDKPKANGQDEGGAVCEIVNVFVRPQHRSQGVGTKLLQEALSNCRNVFFAQQILAHAHVDNHIAHALLHKQGISSSFRRFDFFRRLEAMPTSMSRAPSHATMRLGFEKGREVSPDGYVFADPKV